MNFLYKKSQFLLKKRVKMSFPDHGVKRKVVDNDENYLSMRYQPKLMTFFIVFAWYMGHIGTITVIFIVTIFKIELLT